MPVCVDVTCLTEQNRDTGPGDQGRGQELGDGHLQEGAMAGEAARHPLASATSQPWGGEALRRGPLPL